MLASCRCYHILFDFVRHLDRSTVLTAAHCVNFVKFDQGADPGPRTYESRITVHVGLHHNTDMSNSNSYLVRKIIIVSIIFDHLPTNRR